MNFAHTPRTARTPRPPRVVNAFLLSSLTGLLISCGGGGSSNTSNAGGGSSPPPPIAATALTVACSGSNCGASSITSYSGTGVGVWEYKNTSTNDALVNIDISGLSAGKLVASVFSNGEEANSASLPKIGSQASYKITSKPTIQSELHTEKQHLHDAFDRSHSQHLTKKLATAHKLIPKGSTEAQAFDQQKTNTAETIRYAPSINATRQWMDYDYGAGKAYNTVNKHVCSLPSGRNVVFWQDTLDSNLTPARLNVFTAASCGVNGGFAKLINLIGEPWGAHIYANIISESINNKQDINVVFVNDAAAQWAGYFASRNNFISIASAPSNQALAFFVNTKNIPNDENYFISTLFHEAAHMIEYYQNYILQDKRQNTWLAETFAMMAEDIITPSVSSYNKIASNRLPSYASSGAGYSLSDWSATNTANTYYNMGASLGAFINRQYGVNVFKQLVSGCNSSATLKTDSYACLNRLIVDNGGVGLNDAFTKMNTSVFGRIPSANQPTGYGFPSKVDSGYTLSAIDTSSISMDAANTFTFYNGLTSTYVIDSMASGKTRFTRSGVLVPAKTNLQVVVR